VCFFFFFAMKNTLFIKFTSYNYTETNSVLD